MLMFYYVCGDFTSFSRQLHQGENTKAQSRPTIWACVEVLWLNHLTSSLILQKYMIVISEWNDVTSKIVDKK